MSEPIFSRCPYIESSTHNPESAVLGAQRRCGTSTLDSDIESRVGPSKSSLAPRRNGPTGFQLQFSTRPHEGRYIHPCFAKFAVYGNGPLPINLETKCSLEKQTCDIADIRTTPRTVLMARLRRIQKPFASSRQSLSVSYSYPPCVIYSVTGDFR
jgi:hypothetical protein